MANPQVTEKRMAFTYRGRFHPVEQRRYPQIDVLPFPCISTGNFGSVGDAFTSGTFSRNYPLSALQTAWLGRVAPSKSANCGLGGYR
jgi:hypothetical protein